jgi:hypothetical protein
MGLYTHVRLERMTAALAGRHRQAGTRSFADDSAREPESAPSRTIVPSSPGYNPNTPVRA